MTPVEIRFPFLNEPTEAESLALARIREVYGIRALNLDRSSHSLRVEYDATRLTADAVRRLVRQSGLEIAGDWLASQSAAPPEPPELKASRAELRNSAKPDNLTLVPVGTASVRP
jgi:hypothetical protein